MSSISIYKNRKQLLATFLTIDSSELEDYRYHHGLTSIPVYVIDDTYYCVTKGKQKPATHRHGLEWKWEHTKEVLNGAGDYIVWESAVIS